MGNDPVMDEARRQLREMADQFATTAVTPDPWDRGYRLGYRQGFKAGADWRQQVGAALETDTAKEQ